MLAKVGIAANGSCQKCKESDDRARKAGISFYGPDRKRRAGPAEMILRHKAANNGGGAALLLADMMVLGLKPEAVPVAAALVAVLDEQALSV